MSSHEKSKRGSYRKSLFQRKSCSNFAFSLRDLWNGQYMPNPLLNCFAFIYCYNADTKHVFRKNGNKIAHEVLCSNLRKISVDSLGGSCITSTFYANTAFDVCSALKAYIKDVPRGLLQIELSKDWMKMLKYVCDTDTTKLKTKIQLLIKKMQVENKLLLFYILALSYKISLYHEVNDMSVKSLAIVLAPCIFDQVVDIRKVKYLQPMYKLLEYMIGEVTAILEKESYLKLVVSLEQAGNRIRVLKHSTSLDEEYDVNGNEQLETDHTYIDMYDSRDVQVSYALDNCGSSMDHLAVKNLKGVGKLRLAQSRDSGLNSNSCRDDGKPDSQASRENLLSDEIFPCEEEDRPRISRAPSNTSLDSSSPPSSPPTVPQLRPYSICVAQRNPQQEPPSSPRHSPPDLRYPPSYLVGYPLSFTTTNNTKHHQHHQHLHRTCSYIAASPNYYPSDLFTHPNATSISTTNLHHRNVISSSSSNSHFFRDSTQLV